MSAPAWSDVDGQTYDVAIGHNTLYLVGSDLSLFVYDLAFPSMPQLIGQLAGIENPTSFAETRVIVQGGLALLVSSRDGYRLVDVSTPQSPVEQSYSASPERIYGAVFFEGYALLGAKAGLHVLDIADPKAPVIVMADASFSDIYGVGMVGHRVLVSTSAHLLEVYDLTLPCTDEEPCTLDACHVIEGCAFPAAVCDDLNPCTTDSCTPGQGCVHESLPNCGVAGGAGAP